MPAPADQPTPGVRLRPGRPADVAALSDLENRAFSYDRMSRRGFRRIVASPSAVLIVAEQDGRCAGYALVFFRRQSRVARLYSIAVEPARGGRGIGRALLAAAEDAARRRRVRLIRLEVREGNAAAIARYRKSGYVETGRRMRYYDDGGNALRFEKRMSTRHPPQ
jgi:ribosomal-protein-alanine acetyltransferase